MSRVDFGRFTPTITSEKGPIRTNSMELLKSKAGTGEAKLPPLNFLWLEITGKCNLRCTHCYAESAPRGTHGSLTRCEWHAIIADAKQVGADTVQFIGGEPTLHPDFPEEDWIVTYNTDNETWRDAANDPSGIRFYAAEWSKYRYYPWAGKAQAEDSTPPGIVLCLGTGGGTITENDVKGTWVWLKP
jgi:Radical SAM superfamily/4Fe-4S single cluster domain